jgi:BASS family bile acid:Na+ symporter
MVNDRPNRVAAAANLVHRRFLLIVLATYLVAGVAPRFGIWLKDFSFGTVSLGSQSLPVSLSLVLLNVLLLNAWLGVDIHQLGNIRRSSVLLASGIAANVLVPVAFIGVLQQSLRLWHNPEEVQQILTGLALVASMPIAGSSTAWSQNANGNMALSVGLVLGSTLLSPITAPVALHTVGFLTTGDYSEDLHEIAATGTGLFLGLSVVVPCLLGLGIRAVVSDRWIQAVKPALKLANAVVLVTLIYANAAVSLPDAIAKHDYDYLAITLFIVVALCVTGFATGWQLSRLFGVGRPESVSLMFGLGMNNNGTGLVLAAMTMADHPAVLLPIIIYNLIQHLVAGVVDRIMSRGVAQPQQC